MPKRGEKELKGRGCGALTGDRLLNVLRSPRLGNELNP